MSSRFLFSCLGVAALAVCGMFSVNAVLATCPQTKAYERQCLETVSVHPAKTAGVRPGKLRLQ
jgi:hypothetical protein